MPKFKVYVTQSASFMTEIEAEDLAAAKEVARGVAEAEDINFAEHDCSALRVAHVEEIK